MCWVPHMLDQANVETDDVLVAIPVKNGFDVYLFDPARYLKSFADEFGLGEVWYNEGDEWMAGIKEKQQ